MTQENIKLMSGLFAPEQIPRTAPVKRMHVVDADANFGHVHMICSHCGYDDGWSFKLEDLTQLKRGLPCPVCNKKEKTK